MTIYEKLDQLMLMIKRFESNLRVRAEFKWGQYSIQRYAQEFRVCYFAFEDCYKPISECSMQAKADFAKIFKEFRDAYAEWCDMAINAMESALDKCLKENEDLL